MPPELDREWHTHGYYGSANHNIKAIYQRYLGWFDANPAHLWQHPPEAAGTRYVQAFGGVDATVAKASEFFEQGDLRFAAELASHAVFADPGHGAARELLASVLERLGYGAENATWRNSYLTGARELRTNKIEHTEVSSAGLAPALTITQLFDSIAIRINGPRAWNERLSVGWHFTDAHENYRMELSNGALIHYPTTGNRAADLTVTLTKPQLLQLLATAEPDGIDMSGDSAVLGRLMSLDRQPRPRFRDRHPLSRLTASALSAIAWGVVAWRLTPAGLAGRSFASGPSRARSTAFCTLLIAVCAPCPSRSTAARQGRWRPEAWLEEAPGSSAGLPTLVTAAPA